jgi:hypothetical protein
MSPVSVAAGTNSFEYLQKVSQSEPGDLFISKTGDVQFVDRFSVVTGDTPAFADDGTGINYTQISAIIGSDLLFNNITATSPAGTATAVSADSVAVYGEIDYNIDTLISDLPDLQNFADFLLERYGIPRYRIETLGIALNDLDAGERASVLGLELGDTVKVTFTPSGIPPAVVTFAKVIRIEQNINPADERVVLGLEALSGVVMILDNAEFGKLDSGYFLSGPYNAWTLNDVIYGRLSAGMAVS